MPASEYPFDGSGAIPGQRAYFRGPLRADGNPDDFREFVDRCHQEGIGAIAVDRAPGHFRRMNTVWLASMGTASASQHGDRTPEASTRTGHVDLQLRSQ